MDKKNFNELSDKVYNDIFKKYNTLDDYVEKEIRSARLDADEYSESGSCFIYFSDYATHINDIDSALSHLDFDYDLTDEEWEKLVDVAESAECKAYEDKLDALKDEGYKVKYKWVATSLQFKLRKES